MVCMFQMRRCMGKIAVWGLAPIEPLSGVYCNIKTRAFREEEEEEEKDESLTS